MIKKRFLQFFLLLWLLSVLFVHYVLPERVERTMNQLSTSGVYQIRPDAQALHDSLFVADLHADTMLWKRNFLKRSNTGHVDLPRMQEGNLALQVFSATTKSPSGLNYDENASESDDITKLAVLSFWPPATWTSLYERARYQLAKLKKFARNSAGQFRIIESAEDFEQFLVDRARNKKLSAGVYLIEGAHPLEGNIENLERLYEQGLRVAGLTHFFDNELGGSLHGVSQAGLNEFGKAVVRRANELGISIDVAHASPAMVNDVLNITTKPVILSHGGIKSLCDNNRNINDLLMKRIAATGGLLGVGFWEGAVCQATPEGIVKTIRRAINIMGVEHVALGSDFDGTVATPIDSSGFAVLTQTMMDQGFTEEEIRAVMGENVKNFFLRTLPREQSKH